MTLPTVVGLDEQDLHPIDLERWTSLAAEAVAEMGVRSPAAELNLIFVDADEMAVLNREHMGYEGSTDVLSFPLDLPDPISDEVPTLLGDIVVCPEVAHRNAPTHAGSYEDELALLIVHGVLHIFGYDHAESDERALMQGLERSLLSKFHAS